MYKTVFFDLDGTLLNTIEDLADAGNHVLRIHHLRELSSDAFTKLVGHGVYDLIQKILPEELHTSDLITQAVQQFYDYYKNHACDKTLPYPGILEVLAKLKQPSILLGVLSNKPDSLTKQIIQAYFPDTFTIVSGSLGKTPVKPDPRTLVGMMARLDANPAKTLFCGDSPVDIQTAQNAGINSCAVTWGYRSMDSLKQENPTAIATDPTELFHIIVNDLSYNL